MLPLARWCITSCWVVFFAVWFVAAWFAKRTVERSGTWLRWIWIALIVVVLAGTHGRPLASVSPERLWRATARLAIIAAAVTVVGLAVALWARATLGRNWSGAVVLKDQHELIDSGPYAFVRHPIYTGVLLMVAGTMMSWGTRTAVILFATVVVGMTVKARTEERLLTTHFPDAYPHYRKRVRAWLIPFLL